MATVGDDVKHLTYTQAVIILTVAFAALVFVLAAHGLGFVQ